MIKMSCFGSCSYGIKSVCMQASKGLFSRAIQTNFPMTLCHWMVETSFALTKVVQCWIVLIRLSVDGVIVSFSKSQRHPSKIVVLFLMVPWLHDFFSLIWSRLSTSTRRVILWQSETASPVHPVVAKVTSAMVCGITRSDSCSITCLWKCDVEGAGQGARLGSYGLYTQSTIRCLVRQAKRRRVRPTTLRQWLETPQKNTGRRSERK